MVRPASSIGRKWESAFQESVPDAKTAFDQALPQMADGVINAKARAQTAYQAALASANYDAAVRAGFAPGVADVAYGQRLDQVAQGGFTPSQKAKMVEETVLRRHLSTLIPGIITLATGASGKLKFPSGISDAMKNQIINVALMKYVARFTTATTPATAEAVLIANVADIDDLTLGA